MSTYLKENNVKVKDGTDVNAIMRDMISVSLEGALDEEILLFTQTLKRSR